jgi:hypothetical protein
MSNIVIDLEKKGFISPPNWLSKNIIYLSVVGSVSYGAADTNKISDIDLFGVCIPPKSILFPKGKILGFDDFEEFTLYKKDHIFLEEQEYDVAVRNIASFFKLLNKSNPTVVGALFSCQEDILAITKAGNIMRDNRHLFLSKECFPAFKGYAYSNLKKMESKTPDESGKRFDLVKKYGYDVKFAMHVVRLLLELEQILEEGTINLKKDKDVLKSIRMGEWKIEEIKKWASDKEKSLDVLIKKSSLKEKINKKEIRELLVSCLETHYGSLQKEMVNEETERSFIKEVKSLLEKFD